MLRGEKWRRQRNHVSVRFGGGDDALEGSGSEDVACGRQLVALELADDILDDLLGLVGIVGGGVELRAGAAEEGEDLGVEAEGIVWRCCCYCE